MGAAVAPRVAVRSARGPRPEGTDAMGAGPDRERAGNRLAGSDEPAAVGADPARREHAERRLMDHEGARKLMAEAMGGRLSSDDERELALHLVTCSECKTIYDGLQKAHPALESIELGHPSK